MLGRARGRHRKYGEKESLRRLFDDPSVFAKAPSPVYGEAGVTVRLLALDLYWCPVDVLVRFVLVAHPTRGRKIRLCTDLSLPALEIVRLYGVHFKIEVSFKQALHTVGAYAYHCHIQLGVIAQGFLQAQPSSTRPAVVPYRFVSCSSIWWDGAPRRPRCGSIGFPSPPCNPSLEPVTPEPV